MISPLQQEILRRLAIICERSPGIRFGELLANLGFLVEDQTDQTLREVEDNRLLEIMERHRADLARRQVDAGGRDDVLSRSRSDERICSPSRPGSVTSSSIRSNGSVVMRKKPPSPVDSTVTS